MIGEVKEPTWRPTSNLTTQHLEPGVKHSAGRSVLCNRNTIKERLNTMKRNLFFSLLTIVLMTSSLSAQRPGRAGPDRTGGPHDFATEADDAIHLRDRCCPVIPPRPGLVRVLEMNDDQLLLVAELAEKIAAAVGPLREELHALALELKAELGSDDPDPCTIGGLILAIKDQKIAICTTLRSFDEEFEAILAILGPEQLEKWLTIKHRFCTSRDRCRPPRDRPDVNDEG